MPTPAGVCDFMDARGLGFRNPNPTSHEIVAGWHSRGVRLGLDNLGLGVGSGLRLMSLHIRYLKQTSMHTRSTSMHTRFICQKTYMYICLN